MSTGCSSQAPHVAPAALSAAARGSLTAGLPFPTKDEVVRVDGRALSISGYLAIRSRLKPSIPRETVYDLAVETLAVDNAIRARGQTPDPRIAFQIALYARGELPASVCADSLARYWGAAAPSPVAARQEISRLLERSVVQKNAVALASLP